MSGRSVTYVVPRVLRPGVPTQSVRSYPTQLTKNICHLAKLQRGRGRQFAAVGGCDSDARTAAGYAVAAMPLVAVAGSAVRAGVSARAAIVMPVAIAAITKASVNPCAAGSPGSRLGALVTTAIATCAPRAAAAMRITVFSATVAPVRSGGADRTTRSVTAPSARPMPNPSGIKIQRECRDRPWLGSEQHIGDRRAGGAEHRLGAGAGPADQASAEQPAGDGGEPAWGEHQPHPESYSDQVHTR